MSRPRQAVWLAPTSAPAFRWTAFDSRGCTWDIPRQTSQPAQALAHLLRRDQLFTDAVVKEARALHLCLLAVEGARSSGELTALVAWSLGLGAC